MRWLPRAVGLLRLGEIVWSLRAKIFHDRTRNYEGKATEKAILGKTLKDGAVLKASKELKGVTRIL